jgi:lipopolysaccharide transport system ATP-binding protein
MTVGETNDRAKAGNSKYVWALRDINFEVKQGEVLGIIGKNGAGKSTLLKILSQVTGPTKGTVKSRGRIASLLEVGTGFHPEMTGKENIFLNGAILGMTKKEIATKLDEIVSFSGCERYIDTPVKRYSSGMRVRLAFAVAAFLEPDILVVDEVLAVGDAEFQKKAIGKMQDISNETGRTVLFVSHSMGAIKSLCDRCIVLKNGESVFEGDTEEAINFYFNDNSAVVEDTSLVEREDRKGNGKVLLERVTFLNGNNDIVSEILSGEELKIRLKLKKNKPVNYDKLIVSVNLQDSYDNLALSYVSDEMGSSFSDLSSKDTFELKIPRIDLRAGEYKLRVFISEEGTREEDILDVIENVAILTILEGDFWNVGKLNRKGNYALLDGEFRVV